MYKIIKQISCKSGFEQLAVVVVLCWLSPIPISNARLEPLMRCTRNTDTSLVRPNFVIYVERFGQIQQSYYYYYITLLLLLLPLLLL